MCRALQKPPAAVRREEKEAPRWPIYRPDLDADVTQQSGTVCAAALTVYRAAADCCREARVHICQRWKCLVSTITANKPSDILTGPERKRLENYFYNLLTVWRDLLNKSSSFLNPWGFQSFPSLIIINWTHLASWSPLKQNEHLEKRNFRLWKLLTATCLHQTNWVLVSSKSWRWSMVAAISNITVHISQRQL